MKPLLTAATLAAALAAPTLIAAQPGGCPPGLAKKSPACVPPGLAKKGVTTHDRVGDDDHYHDDDHDHWRIGDRLDDDEYFRRIRDRTRYELPPLRDGESYYLDGETVYRVDNDSRAILDIIALTGLLTR
ncbi:hypothetical protein [Tranquillimonas alkanivorans]|uniref:Regulator RcnB of Ni and Co efflux n=1 Tax=Tranquillimonas alkanivorans TaxID=441119 RepID=A0A1I5NYV5_9RHOB|nr:hypothetical protein [Tranquillimonas alkanivorans]SFP27008.1 regulator RcnB of Ni and Co efflux [Tranquillimonas alkanivorans]